jgi:DnaK suppressor protein
MPIPENQRETYRKLLTDIAEDLRHQLAAEDPTKDSIKLDNAIGRLTRMEAIQAQSMGAEGRRRAEQRMTRIQRALDRLEKGIFGDCTACGEEIPEGRLGLLPDAALCIRCAQRRR